MVKQALNLDNARNNCAVPDRIAQPQPPPNLPSEAILYDTVRVFEQALAARGLIDTGLYRGVTPLWFLAETERNIYLWRRGLSLDQSDNFEFWVDLRALIDKQRGRVRTSEEGGASSWHEDNPLGFDAARSFSYFSELLRHFGSIALHAHALSRAASQVRREVSPGESIREFVLLPALSRPR